MSINKFLQPGAGGAAAGELRGAGINRGQIGDGSFTQAQTWTPENNAWTDISRVSSSHRHAAIIRGGVGYVAGDALYQQLNQGNDTDQNTYVEFLGGGSGCIDIFAGYHSTHIIKDDGTLWGIGYNSNGRLGVGDTTNKTVLTQESSGWTDWTRVYGGYNHNGALRGNDLYTAGFGGWYQLGIPGDNSDKTSFVYSTGNVDKFQGGATYSLILTTDGKIYGVGRNNQGQLGVGDTSNRQVWTQEALGYTWTDICAYIGSSAKHVCALRDDGTVWGWGYSTTLNENGDVTGSSTSTPTEILPSTSGTFTGIGVNRDGGYAIDNNGDLWFWGSDANYQDGDGDTTDTELQPPRRIDDTEKWLTIGGGDVFGVGTVQ